MFNFRLIPSLLFALVLLFAQQGGVLHTLRHSFAEQVQKQNKQVPHAHDCEECTAYAQLGSALNSGILAFDFYASLPLNFTAKLQSLLTRHSLPAIARGPPSIQRSA